MFLCFGSAAVVLRASAHAQPLILRSRQISEPPNLRNLRTSMTGDSRVPREEGPRTPSQAMAGSCWRGSAAADCRDHERHPVPHRPVRPYRHTGSVATSQKNRCRAKSSPARGRGGSSSPSPSSSPTPSASATSSSSPAGPSPSPPPPSPPATSPASPRRPSCSPPRPPKALRLRRRRRRRRSRRRRRRSKARPRR